MPQELHRKVDIASMDQVQESLNRSRLDRILSWGRGDPSGRSNGHVD